MITSVTAKIAVAAAGLVLAGAAAAAAAAAGGTPPAASDEGRATAEEHTGLPVPVVHEAEGDTPEGNGDETDGGPVDNHGAAVSAIARDDTLTGREHGEAVSEVARSDAGKSSRGDDEDREGGEVHQRAPQGMEHGNARGEP